MKHSTNPTFWNYYHKLPHSVQKLADKNFRLLEIDEKHPSLRFKRLIEDLWSVRVGQGYRALGSIQEDGNILWFWVGTHAEYDKLIRK